MTEIAVHPIQTSRIQRWERSYVPQTVTLRAYEVYKNLHGEQKALIEGECRGGFGVGELMAFLYARSFPQDEWRARFTEALNGMKGL